MITILIVGNNIQDNERIAGSIIGGTELATCVISTRSAAEALEIAESRTYKIDLFIISIRMKDQSGNRLAEKIRKIPEYRECPILFVTGLSYNHSGFSDLATFQSYRKYNYISLPIERTDVQGKLGLYLEEIVSNQTSRDKPERAVYLSHSKGEVFIPRKEILFAEVRSKVCQVVTENGSYEISRQGLEDLISLVDDDLFLRCHRGFALNIRQLKGIEKLDGRIWTAVFKNAAGPCLISRTYIDQVMERYRAFQAK
jgi:DNA-binding LytR/AlgR family response regulator